jgi:acyl-CoA reductase-like NAD-dependent aldehyde dehydrogenase
MGIEIQVPGARVVSTNPATGEVVREFDCASATEVQAAVARAHAAQPAWRVIAVRKRLDIIATFQQLLNERKQHVAHLITSEAGKPIAEALLTEILVVLDAVRFALELSLFHPRDRDFGGARHRECCCLEAVGTDTALRA